MFFKLQYKYYLKNFFEDKINFYLRSYFTKKLVNKLRELIFWSFLCFLYNKKVNIATRAIY